MNKIVKTTAFFLAALWFAGCHEDTTEGVTSITYYPSITLLGDARVIVDKGTTYTDAGCVVMLNGEDVTDDAIIRSTVDTSRPGIYSVSYFASNEEGFSASSERQVLVVDPASFATVYWGESEFGARHYYDALVVITEAGGGAYRIDDLAGGFYFNGRYPGYEPSYDFHLEAELALNGDQSLTLLDVGSWYWDGTDMSLTSGVYDPATKTITMELDFGGDPFYVTLTSVSN
jgi:hypothetical protein